MALTKLSILPPVLAHRGASQYAPENTLAAFREAKKRGANWVEFDVMLTADHEVVVIHDETLERTTNGTGQVIAHPYHYIQSLDAGSWFNPAFTGEKIPTLREVIALLAELKLSANIEIKAQIGDEALAVKKVLSAINDCWKKEMPAPLVSSFSLAILEEVRKQSSTSLIGFLMHEWNPEWENICDRLDACTVNVNEAILTRENVDVIKASERPLLAYTVDDPRRAHDLFSWGVDAVFTNCPDLILKT